MGCCTTNENIHFIHRSPALAQCIQIQHCHCFIYFWDHLTQGSPEWWQLVAPAWRGRAGLSAAPEGRSGTTGGTRGPSPTFSDGASPSRLGEAVALPHGAAEADVHEALRGRRQRRTAAQQDADLAAQQHPHLAEDKAETRREKDTLVLKNKATECLALDLNWNFPLSSNTLLWHPSQTLKEHIEVSRNTGTYF